MSLETYYLHVIFETIPALFSSDLILYIVPALTLAILFFSIRLIFFKSPKLRKVN